jgi:hypothetical protein
MKRRLLFVALLGLLAVGCAGDSSEVPFLPPGRAIDASRSLAQTTHFFGDIVRARVEVRIDRRQLDPERLRVEARFDPYEPVEAPLLDRRDLGPYSVLRYEYALRCLTLACIPEQLQTELGAREGARGERRTFRFPEAEVRYDDASGEFPGLLRSVSWPPLTSVSRLNEAQAEAEFPFRARPELLPAASYRASPTLATGGLLLAGLALIAWPVGLGVRAWRRRRPEAVAEPASLTPLERALRLAEWSIERPDPDDRRRSLEVLAEELEQSGVAELSERASELAWARAEPSPDAVSALVERVRQGECDGSPA